MSTNIVYFQIEFHHALVIQVPETLVFLYGWFKQHFELF